MDDRRRNIAHSHTHTHTHTPQQKKQKQCIFAFEGKTREEYIARCVTFGVYSYKVKLNYYDCNRVNDTTVKTRDEKSL